MVVSKRMPGNQTGTEGEVEVKASYMTKRSQGKSALKTVNFKKRVFVLTPNRLAYFEGTLEVRDKGERGMEGERERTIIILLTIARSHFLLNLVYWWRC